jgi:hypothetical protein
MKPTQPISPLSPLPPLRNRLFYQATVILCFLVIACCVERQAREIRHLRRERADQVQKVALLESLNQMQWQSYHKDQVYIGWLEKQVSRFEDGEPGNWRERAGYEHAFATHATHAVSVEMMFPVSPGLLPGARASWQDQKQQREKLERCRETRHCDEPLD